MPLQLTPYEIDYFSQDLLIAITKAEDLGDELLAGHLQRILDDLDTYGIITAPDQILLYQVTEL